MTISTTIKTIRETIDRKENAMYTQYDLYWCADRLGWLWKFREINEETMSEFAERITRLFEMGID